MLGHMKKAPESIPELKMCLNILFFQKHEKRGHFLEPTKIVNLVIRRMVIYYCGMGAIALRIATSFSKYMCLLIYCTGEEGAKLLHM